jgi:hypothetical protein
MNLEERRRKPRFKLDQSLEYKSLNADPWRIGMSDVLEVSEGGLQFSSGDSIPQKTLMIFTINAGHPCYFLGRTVWSSQQESSDTFDIGAELVFMNSDEVKELKLIIAEHESES